MRSHPNIRHLTRTEIDIEQWNKCIDASVNGLVYAYSWYLDAMCDHWDALVMDDYAAVMPLPWRKKWGIKYVYTPAFVQQLGLIGQNDMPLLREFVRQLHRFTRYGDYHLNFDNPMPGLNQRSNYVLPLHHPYSIIRKRYTQNLHRNLSRAGSNSLRYENSNDFKLAINVFRGLFARGLPGTSTQDFENFARFCFNQPRYWCMRMISDNFGQPVATMLMLVANNRYYLLLPAVTPRGRELSAGHYLIDQFIQEHAESHSILDFEGSDLPGVQRYYKSFGGTDMPFFFYHWNHLPQPLRWLKK